MMRTMISDIDGEPCVVIKDLLIELKKINTIPLYVEDGLKFDLLIKKLERTQG